MRNTPQLPIGVCPYLKCEGGIIRLLPEPAFFTTNLFRERKVVTQGMDG